MNEIKFEDIENAILHMSPTHRTILLAKLMAFHIKEQGVEGRNQLIKAALDYSDMELDNLILNNNFREAIEFQKTMPIYEELKKEESSK